MDPMGKIIVDHEFGNQRALDRIMGGGFQLSWNLEVGGAKDDVKVGI